MNSTSSVSETSSSSCRHQHPNVKEEIDADSVELAIEVKEEVKKEEDELNVAGPSTRRCGSTLVDSVIIKFEDEEVTCQCEECDSACHMKMVRCTRVMAECSSQAIKKEKLETDERRNEQPSGEMAVKEEKEVVAEEVGKVVKMEDDADWAPVRIKREGIEAEIGGEAGCRKKAKRTEILVKEEVKEEEDERNVVDPLTERYGSTSVDLVIIKFEDDEVTCLCEECGMIKAEEEEEEVKEEIEGANEVVTGHRVEEEVTVEGGESEDGETVVEDGSEDEEDWMASTGSSLGSSSEEEEEETGDGPADLVHEPIETGPSTASLEVGPLAGADIEQVQTAKGRIRHRCPQCQKMVTNLTPHLLTHTGERPHICDQCGKGFTQKSDLKRHLKIHSGEKAFSCQHCGKGFTHKGHLTIHLKRHSGEKAHQCDQCPSAFVSSTDLTLHRRYKHTGERPYTCPIANCHKAFTRQSELGKHLLYHNGEKRHHCEDCERRFVTKKELTRHRHYKHSTERPYRCPHSGCNYATAEKCKLRKHLNTRKHCQ